MVARLLLCVALLGCGLFCSSCGSRRTAATLNDIETYIQERPDSALAEIRVIDTTTLSSRRLRAQYTLLQAMALDKNWIDTTDVNVVMPAVTYYDRHPSGDRQAKAWYYLGRIQYNNAEYDKAIISFTFAGDYSENSPDERFKSLVYQATADTYGQSGLPEESCHYSELAYSTALKAKDTILANASLYRLAQGYSNLKDLDRADSLYQQLLQRKAQVSPNAYPRILADYALFMTNYTDKYEEAVSFFNESLNLTHGFSEINYWCAYAFALAQIGNAERSESIFRQLSVNAAETNAYKTWKSRTCALNHDYQTAYRLLSETSDIQTELLMKYLRQSVVKAQRDYYEAKKEKAEESNRMLRWGLILSVITFISLLVAAYLLIKRARERAKEKNRLLELENSSLQKAISSLSDQMTDMSLRQATLQREFTTHLQSSFREWGRLYKALYQENKSNQLDIRDSVYFEACKAVSKLTGDAQGQKMLEDRLNELFDQVMTHYRADFPSRTESDYHFAAFVFAGFDASVLKIAFQTSSLSATYERKSRLKDSITKSSARHKEQYLLFFR